MRLDGWKTLIGAAIALIAQILDMMGVAVDDVAQITETVNVTVTNVVTLAGIVLAIYGRLKARRRIGGSELQ